MDHPSNKDELIDSRDVIAAIEDLSAATDLADDDAELLRSLRDLADECNGFPDWAYGETLIRDSYFEDYAQDLAEDIGAIDSNASWPNTCIDWELAARELQYDYSPVDFDGVTYWIRA
jgi:hypothetical protein